MRSEDISKPNKDLDYSGNSNEMIIVGNNNNLMDQTNSEKEESVQNYLEIKDGFSDQYNMETLIEHNKNCTSNEVTLDHINKLVHSYITQDSMEEISSVKNNLLQDERMHSNSKIMPQSSRSSLKSQSVYESVYGDDNKENYNNEIDRSKVDVLTQSNRSKAKTEVIEGNLRSPATFNIPTPRQSIQPRSAFADRFDN
jgi:hypothetical protein